MAANTQAQTLSPMSFTVVRKESQQCESYVEYARRRQVDACHQAELENRATVARLIQTPARPGCHC